MKKKLLKTTMLATLATLAMSGSVYAHHPLQTINPELFEQIDDILESTNSRHNEIMDAMLEDGDMMARTTQSMAGETMVNQQTNGTATTAASMTANRTSNFSGASNINRTGPR